MINWQRPETAPKDVVFCINRGTPFDVRYAPDSGAKADIAGLPRWADSVEKGDSCDAEISVIQSV
jgi:hypothetical protein